MTVPANKWIHSVLAVLLLYGPTPSQSSDGIKVPDSVAALAKKYDEARKRSLGPILDAFAAELKIKTVPDVTRSGNAETALYIASGADSLKNVALPLIPQEGAPFKREALEVIRATTEWQSFLTKFQQAETVLHDSYERALERERATFLAQGDPHGVLAVDQERKRIEGFTKGVLPQEKTPAMPAPSTPAPSVQASKPAAEKVRIEKLEALFVGRMFGVNMASSADRHEYYFRKNGEVVRRVVNAGIEKTHETGTWKIEEDHFVVVSGLVSPKWFWFEAGGGGEMRQGEKGGKSRYKLELVTGAKDPG